MTTVGTSIGFLEAQEKTKEAKIARADAEEKAE